MSATTTTSSPPGALEERVRRALGRSAETGRITTATSARRALVRRSLEAARQQRTASLESTRSAAVARRRDRAGLTPRQHEILMLVSDGLSTKQIARELWLSPATVRNHVAAIMTALGTHSRLEAVAAARRAGLLAPTRPPE
jgi:DNA-binding NarL/FixJ family response regulator